MKLLEYDLSPRVRAFSTCRQGGFSQGNYGPFNANAFCGDDLTAVRRNRQLLADELGIPADRLIFTHQIHSTLTRVVDEQFLSLPASQRSNMLEGVDALITDQPDACLCISTADCIPVVLYDRRHHAAACIHAGWRGTMRRIVESSFLQMHTYYGTAPEDCTAQIGPGISVANYGVGDEVYEAFRQADFPMEHIARREQSQFRVVDGTLSCPTDKWHIDLAAANRLQLLGLGLAQAQVHDCHICTYDHADEFFSARRLGVRSGRIITGVMLRPDA